MKEIILSRELLEIHDKYDRDLGLLDERWASPKDRQRVTAEQCKLLEEYQGKLRQIRLEGFAAEMQTKALERIREIEEVKDPVVAEILRKRAAED
ncbi:MAG: hypothetical protein EOP85_20140 [Verrucomicrobiaceae bacterium]|nr:MAG: hypothetical protein EOP85_20140 [Verrucomicrobiaceae bacterium]